MLSDEREIDMLMSGRLNPALASVPAVNLRKATADPLWARVLIGGLAMIFLALFLVVPLAAVFAEAFREGARVYIAAITNSEARSAIQLTLLTAAVAVPLNLVFGVAAAWA